MSVTPQKKKKRGRRPVQTHRLLWSWRAVAGQRQVGQVSFVRRVFPVLRGTSPLLLGHFRHLLGSLASRRELDLKKPRGAFLTWTKWLRRIFLFCWPEGFPGRKSHLKWNWLRWAKMLWNCTPKHHLTKTWSGQWNIREITLTRLNLSINNSPRELLPVDLLLEVSHHLGNDYPVVGFVFGD